MRRRGPRCLVCRRPVLRALLCRLCRRSLDAVLRKDNSHGAVIRWAAARALRFERARHAFYAGRRLKAVGL